MRGLTKLETNAGAMAADLDKNWEVLAEPIQTVMRRHGVERPYEKLKELTRGRRVDKAGMQEFVSSLDIPDDSKARLMEMTPANYIGEGRCMLYRCSPRYPPHCVLVLSTSSTTLCTGALHVIHHI